MTKLAIVILNYNGLAHLRRFLPTVLLHADGHEVWVADNASTDGSVDWLIEYQPDVKLLRYAQNTGYAGGYNAALRDIEAEYYLLLNSDVEVTAGWLASLLALMDSDSRIAACQPKIRAYDLRTHFEYAGAAGGFMDYLGYPFCRGRIFDTREEDRGQYDDIREVFWATGACLMMRGSAFREAGGFDDRFFAHMEEIDLCWRLLTKGYRIMYCGYSTVFHVGGGTLHKSNPRKTFLNYRNNLLMMYKNLPRGRRKKTILIRLVLDGLSSVRYILAGAWPDVWAIVQAHFAFYRMLGQFKQTTVRTQQRAPLYYKSVVWEYFVKRRTTFTELPEWYR